MGFPKRKLHCQIIILSYFIGWTPHFIEVSNERCCVSEKVRQKKVSYTLFTIRTRKNEREPVVWKNKQREFKANPSMNNDESCKFHSTTGIHWRHLDVWNILKTLNTLFCKLEVVGELGTGGRFSKVPESSRKPTLKVRSWKNQNDS